MSPAVEQIRKTVEERVRELRPVIDELEQLQGVTATEISERTGVKRTVVSATINRLKRNGELEPLGQGVRVPSGRRPCRPRSVAIALLS
jgi:transposase